MSLETENYMRIKRRLVVDKRFPGASPQIAIRFDPETMRALIERAKRDKVSVAHIVRQCVLKEIKPD